MTAAPNTPRYFALIPAAGVGARMQAGSPKQYLSIAGKPMLRHALDAFLASPLIAHAYVVVSADDGVIDTVVPQHGVTVLRCGGATRMETILNALQALHGSVAAHDQVLVHDAARPGLTPALIEKLITEVGAHAAGGLLALPVVDTVKRAGPGNVSARTVPRDGLWLAQTPQMFSYALLHRALSEAPDPLAITDDASAVEALGLAPTLVEGHPRNLKVTLPRDIHTAELYLANPCI
ncbi:MULTISPECIES: 2-C-methyl-D-erythritol 4-phosphate cytidylyltransferase [unclassified Janthinobacterium]|uniref:2-C-methyl-D-erythritol 4-phosphate cytidylyltransferase n=1 Tax=unclassified Janthinobacterium TaxID=2610881 RepID=UPI00088E009B|nr:MULTISPECIES: 2-C-methyl-D-erythritol 4-phosphate cytidylyltransferase [unclassified Janthinobacterium]SDA40909.1 2-C-methyl-D-erythritol 4-phosphate cytidylyltransferase [Janthinobacterium sp. 551a]SFA84565.1 2-C-methyl-D-erythritol 4-phosphate cytidylyltransferase [Janthinobacterium sp. 344]